MVTVRRPPPQPHVCCIILQPLITMVTTKAPDYAGAHPDFGKLPIFLLFQTHSHTHTNTLPSLLPPPPPSFLHTKKGTS